jgi:hypothetical protein
VWPGGDGVFQLPLRTCLDDDGELLRAFVEERLDRRAMIQQTAPLRLHQGLLEGGDGASMVPRAVAATLLRDISLASGHSRIAGWRSYKVWCN